MFNPLSLFLPPRFDLVTDLYCQFVIWINYLFANFKFIGYLRLAQSDWTLSDKITLWLTFQIFFDNSLYLRPFWMSISHSLSIIDPKNIYLLFIFCLSSLVFTLNTTFRDFDFMIFYLKILEDLKKVQLECSSFSWRWKGGQTYIRVATLPLISQSDSE